MEIYEVDGLVFRVDPEDPQAWAERLTGTEWETVYLTGQDVLSLLDARETLHGGAGDPGAP